MISLFPKDAVGAIELISSAISSQWIAAYKVKSRFDVAKRSTRANKWSPLNAGAVFPKKMRRASFISPGYVDDSRDILRSI